MLRVSDLVEAMEAIAPPALAEPWDNVGLIAGDAGASLSGPTLLTIDLDERVVSEAVTVSAGKPGAIVAYHPPIFSGIKRLTGESPRGRALLRAIGAGFAIYSPHTALDATAGGVADWLIDQVGSGADRVALSAFAEVAGSQSHKVVCLVPVASPPNAPMVVVDQVRSAMATAGAGRIGAYDECSFGVRGIGSFFGGVGTNPAIGARGRLESVEEVRLEMVCSRRDLPAVIAALRAAHPYEEPAFDIHELAPKPRRDLGPGRAMTLEQPASVEAIAQRLAGALKIAGVQMTDAAEGEPISRVAVCPGSGESLIRAAIEHGAQVFITGEMKHHEALAALDRGISIILAGHTQTERGYLPTLARLLNDANPALRATVSREDRATLRFVMP